MKKIFFTLAIITNLFATRQELATELVEQSEATLKMIEIATIAIADKHIQTAKSKKGKKEREKIKEELTKIVQSKEYKTLFMKALVDIATEDMTKTEIEEITKIYNDENLRKIVKKINKEAIKDIRPNYYQEMKKISKKELEEKRKIYRLVDYEKIEKESYVELEKYITKEEVEKIKEIDQKPTMKKFNKKLFEAFFSDKLQKKQKEAIAEIIDNKQWGIKTKEE